MINKPGRDMRRSFWHADAWAAARAEKPASWHTPYPENPLFSRVMVGFLMFASLMHGLQAAALCFAFFFGLAVVGNLLRQTLMYLSIRRYGAWKEMAPEMRAVIENPSDLAQGPARFAAMPRGFTSTADASAPDRPSLKSKVGSVLIFLAVWLLFAMMVD